MNFQQTKEDIKQLNIADWNKLFSKVSDPDVIEDNIRKAKVDQRQEERKKDVGL